MTVRCWIPRLLISLLSCCGTRASAEPQVAHAWTFGGESAWAGWHPNGGIRDAAFDQDAVTFRTTTADPQLTGPRFELSPASNQQWIEIDLDCDAPGWGELFYTNKITGRYGGLEPHWMSWVVVPSAGRQVVRVWPFWEGLGKIMLLRLDPPDGVRCRLHAIRIVQQDADLPPSKWAFDEQPDSWAPMYAASVARNDGGLVATAQAPQAVIITPVEPFDAARRSILRLEADVPGDHVLGLHWVTQEEPGLSGEPISTPDKTAGSRTIDLRQFPGWEGTITHLAVAFGTRAGDELRLRSLAIEDNEPDRPFLRVVHCGFERPVNRAGRPARLKIVVEHAGGPPAPAGHMKLACGDGTPPMTLDLRALYPGDRFEAATAVTPRTAGPLTVTVDVNGQTFETILGVDEPVDVGHAASPQAPPPRPVDTKYDIGIYYFPGWSPDQISRWRSQAGFPERDPVLGWYEEGNPDVADWHIKWARENGISFFIYDWYWRSGREDLTAGLNDGFLKSRYCEQMKFAVMWANHRPFADHTIEQLLTVTDYWIEHYLRRPNYLTVDGKPYVSFFSPGELTASLGSEEKVREAFAAMRERARGAGLPGLHVGACAGTSPPQLRWLERAGFDSITGYNYRRTGATLKQSVYRQFLLGHEATWEAIQQADILPYIPLLTVGWDSRPWHGPRAERRFARRTEDFAAALARLKANLDATGGRMAILEAWNEWGEGSYIEPNAEFGFRDLEAIRATFAEPGDWPVNIGPDDLGHVDPYDLRRAEAGTRAALDHGKPVKLVGVHPAVAEGLELRCWEDRIAVMPGRARAGDREWACSGGSVAVAPAEADTVKGPVMHLNAGAVQAWRGGNRLTIERKDRWQVLPDSYVPGSLHIWDPDHPGIAYRPGRDFIVDNQWGAFSIPEGSQGAAGFSPRGPSASREPYVRRSQLPENVRVRYEVGLRRIDALVLDADGSPRLIPGGPEPDCPEPPAVPEGALHLANIYRPFHATRVEPHHVYVITGETPDLSPVANAPGLAGVLEKLRGGKDVTIVCWGDSVTVGGDATIPSRSYVGRFETMLKERFPAASIRVINAGIGGSNTKQRFPSFNEEVLSHRPDLVTLEFVNDMGFPVDEMEARYVQILESVRGAGAGLILITPHFTRPDWIKLPNGRGPDPRKPVAFLRRFAAENDVALADASRRWEQLERLGIPYETLLKNGINHPDDRGHLIFAEELMRLLPE